MLTWSKRNPVESCWPPTVRFLLEMYFHLLSIASRWTIAKSRSALKDAHQKQLILQHVLVWRYFFQTKTQNGWNGTAFITVTLGKGRKAAAVVSVFVSLVVRNTTEKCVNVPISDVDYKYKWKAWHPGKKFIIWCLSHTQELGEKKSNGICTWFIKIIE